MENVNVYAQKGIELAFQYGPKVVSAILTLIIGLWIIGVLQKVFRKALNKGGVDETLVPFLGSLFTWALKALLFISVASMLGIATTSFVAVLGAAGLAVGLALQGSLANFAGGVLVLIFRPYKIGDLIEAQGKLGVVQEIQIFNTIITTPENKRVILPNGAVSNGSITNYSAEGKLRVDLSVGISYGSDIKKAKEIVEASLRSVPNVLQDPAPSVNVSELGDSAVVLAVRPWAAPAHYWDVYFGSLEKVKLDLDAAGISIPFPQRDVHIFNQKG